MTYKPVDRSFDKNYLKEQHNAMRWLKETFSLTNEQIRTFNWGNITEADKIMQIQAEVVDLKFNLKTWEISKNTRNREFQCSLKNTPYEYFFLKSRVYCHWVFLKERPKTWRMEGSKSSLYSLSEVEKICGKDVEKISDNVLTFLNRFATIEVSKLNITKVKTEGAKEESYYSISVASN